MLFMVLVLTFIQFTSVSSILCSFAMPAVIFILSFVSFYFPSMILYSCSTSQPLNYIPLIPLSSVSSIPYAFTVVIARLKISLILFTPIRPVENAFSFEVEVPELPLILGSICVFQYSFSRPFFHSGICKQMVKLQKNLIQWIYSYFKCQFNQQILFTNLTLIASTLLSCPFVPQKSPFLYQSVSPIP